ncbi:helix-turn-helix transcriptional regulator [Levilactobacillus brevis]|uniref:helix-turn-helix transcriptional regulator n=1 Tax=Levilactobacillus brevis TaxID=1580 RepID=UPI0035A26BC9
MQAIAKKRVDLEFIKRLRNENHLSQADVTKAIGLSTPDKYNRRENGDYNFKAEELQALAELFHVPMEKFFTSSV